ncbi:MAG: DegT/DnrJ/EryC1/StrS family aminotransferase [bacterium]
MIEATAPCETQSRIPITKPNFGDAEFAAVREVLESGWLVQGPKVAEFERRFAELTGSRNAVATTSCTTALHLLLVAAGVGRGDSVILPAFTFVASANAVEYTGARPQFIDIDLKTFNIDSEQVAQFLETRASANAKCLLPVSLFGLCAEMPSLNRLAERHGLRVIEDAACGFGARREGRHAGTEVWAGAFSLHPRKAITTGEGGMIVTDDDELASQLRRLRDHGASATDLQRHLESGGSLLPEFNQLGYNYRLTDIQAALGLVQLETAATMIEQRRTLAERYNKLLSDCPRMILPTEPGGYRHAYQSYVCLFGADSIEELIAADISQIETWNRERNQLMAALETEGIATRQGTHALHTLGFYRGKYGLESTDFPNAFRADRLSLALPLYPQLTAQDQHRVADTLKRHIPA